jgi:hypothetical protein
MVRTYKDGTGINFGHGTTRIYSAASKERGQLKLTTCVPHKGSKDIIEVPGSHKVILNFTDTASIDILIHKLNDLKDQMEVVDGEETSES